MSGIEINDRIKQRYREMERTRDQLRKDLVNFMNMPCPNEASNIVRLASGLARAAQGYQDMTDVADLPRGHNPFEEGKKEDPPCTRCGCPRVLHLVNVGGERTGCFDHFSCDEWRQDKSLPLSTVCVCGHTKNWHTHGRGSSCQVGPDTTSAAYCPCPEFKEDQ